MTQDGITALALSVFVTLTFFFYIFYRLQRLINHLENRYWMLAILLAASLRR